MKKSISLAAGIALALATAPGWAQNANTGPLQPDNHAAPQQSTTPTRPTTDSDAAGKPVEAHLNASDRAFVQKATIGGMAEIQEGQLAQDKAQSADVKAFGQTLVSDHTAAGQKLKAIVDAEGLQAPDNIDAPHKKEMTSLEKLRGAAFDRRFVQHEVTEHKETIALFKKETTEGSDPQLKQFATDTLPTLQQHLSQAEKLAKEEKMATK